MRVFGWRLEFFVKVFREGADGVGLRMWCSRDGALGWS